MIPQPWTFVLLALAGYRLLRFLGWDDWPPIARTRGWIIGERWVPIEPKGTDFPFMQPGVDVAPSPLYQYLGRSPTGDDPSLPGKTPSSEAEAVRPAYDRPLLAHLWHCPYCLGWWVCLTGWAAWLIWPHAVTWLAVPWAASGVVGLIAKVLDP